MIVVSCCTDIEAHPIKNKLHTTCNIRIKIPNGKYLNSSTSHCNLTLKTNQRLLIASTGDQLPAYRYSQL